MRTGAHVLTGRAFPPVGPPAFIIKDLVAGILSALTRPCQFPITETKTASYGTVEIFPLHLNVYYVHKEGCQGIVCFCVRSERSKGQSYWRRGGRIPSLLIFSFKVVVLIPNILAA